jgi:hypothetical protein
VAFLKFLAATTRTRVVTSDLLLFAKVIHRD